MSNDQIIRAWKDANYRATLSEMELAQLPSHPAGIVDISEAQLDTVSGGMIYGTVLCTKVCVTLVCHTNVCLSLYCVTQSKSCL